MVKYLFFIEGDVVGFPYERFPTSFFRGSLGFHHRSNLDHGFRGLELKEAKMSSRRN